MYEAKKLGKKSISLFFTETLNETVQNAILLNRNMRLALENDEYELFLST